MIIHSSLCLICAKKLSEHTDKEIVACSIELVYQRKKYEN